MPLTGGSLHYTMHPSMCAVDSFSPEGSFTGSVTTFEWPPPLPYESEVESFVPFFYDSFVTMEGSSTIMTPGQLVQVWPILNSVVWTTSELEVKVLSHFAIGDGKSFAPQQVVIEFASRSFNPQEQTVVSSMLVFAPTVTISFATAVQSPTEVPAFSRKPLLANYAADGISSVV